MTEELQSSALKRIVSLARNVQKLDVASVEELLSKLSLDAAGSICAFRLNNYAGVYMIRCHASSNCVCRCHYQ